MTEMENGYKLEQGETYHFKVKVRAEKGAGSFQLVFSTKSEGLRVINKKKWTALDINITPSCEWRNLDFYFTVPTDNNHEYSDMKYLVLRYNNEQNAALVLHYDEVVLTKEPKCIDYRYIQNWTYFDIHKIEQANIQIKAGENVSPYAYDYIGSVTVKAGSMVIYRAPTVTLDSTFIVEDGAYFSTEVGTCIEDPCPPIPDFAPPTETVCANFSLGSALVDTPGVFYEWLPHEYFSNPWSRETNFIVPSSQTSGCLTANLVAWTICGDSKTYDFRLKFFTSPPSISILNQINSANKIEMLFLVQNANSYTVSPPLFQQV